MVSFSIDEFGLEGPQSVLFSLSGGVIFHVQVCGIKVT